MSYHLLSYILLIGTVIIACPLRSTSTGLAGSGSSPLVASRSLTSFSRSLISTSTSMGQPIRYYSLFVSIVVNSLLYLFLNKVLPGLLSVFSFYRSLKHIRIVSTLAGMKQVTCNSTIHYRT